MFLALVYRLPNDVSSTGIQVTYESLQITLDYVIGLY